jgi:hypothetical protein
MADLPDRIHSLAERTKVPPALTTAGLRERFGDPREVEPAPGQVWRADWDGVVRLVLLLTLADRLWRVVPITVEPTSEDDQCLVAEVASTAFSVEVTAWAGLATSIPTGTLGTVLDQWTQEATAWCTAAAAGTFGEPPEGARRGRVRTLYDWTDTVRAELADDLEKLAVAPLVPTRAPDTVDLKVAAARVGLRNVITGLGIPQNVVMKIVQGKQPPTAEQAQVLAGLFGFAVEDVMAAASLPEGLAVELERPRWRNVWRSMARRLQIGEAQARVRVGFGTFAVAFRQTGGAAPDWRSRIEQWLSAHDNGSGSS